MRVLLDTNILIQREASRVVRDDIGILFHWLDRLGYAKCVHPLSVAEITSHQDPTVVRTMIAKLQSYVQLKTTAPDSAKLQEIRTKYDRDQARPGPAEQRCRSVLSVRPQGRGLRSVIPGPARPVTQRAPASSSQSLQARFSRLVTTTKYSAGFTSSCSLFS